jgi:hypothetical protein
VGRGIDKKKSCTILPIYGLGYPNRGRISQRPSLANDTTGGVNYINFQNFTTYHSYCSPWLGSSRLWGFWPRLVAGIAVFPQADDMLVDVCQPAGSAFCFPPLSTSISSFMNRGFGRLSPFPTHPSLYLRPLLYRI